MHVILLGCPGAGKGTQAQYLSEHYNIPLISTGNMLRSAIESGTPLGLKVKQVMESGDLVSDGVIIELVKDRLHQNDCQNGYLLDGFPRTVKQAEAIYQAGIKIDLIIEIFVPDNNVVERLSGRRIHPGSGRVYHLKYNPPITPGIDDIAKEELVQRDDDREETIYERLRVYREKTEPLIQYYQNLTSSNKNITPKYLQIDGRGDINQTRQKIFSTIRAELS
ncbi:MAG: adenylate kinase [Coxiellaceae bacterium]|nr:adenylate kinase [Coxiellaceae bacterium]